MSSNDSSAPRGASSRRAELKRSYKEKPPDMGVFAVRNRANGKLLVGTSLNLPPFGRAPRIRRNFPALQDDWGRVGAEAFSFEVLDGLAPPEGPGGDLK